jgi:hypothetical protein
MCPSLCNLLLYVDLLLILRKVKKSKEIEKYKFASHRAYFTQLRRILPSGVKWESRDQAHSVVLSVYVSKHHSRKLADEFSAVANFWRANGVYDTGS